jgi:prevent-host-death family protein
MYKAVETSFSNFAGLGLIKFHIIAILDIMRILEDEMEIRVTSSQFQQSFGALSDKARYEPVVITKHGHPSLVVMAMEEWERLKRRDRRVGPISALPQEWADVLQEARVPDEYAHLDAEVK